MFLITTNGTLIHGEIANWLSKNKERVRIKLSLDGDKQTHDRNRVKIDGTGTFDEIIKKYSIYCFTL